MYLRPTRSLSFAWRRSCLAKPQNFFSWIMKVFTSLQSRLRYFFFLVVHSSTLGPSPIWSSILIFVHSTIWRDFSKRLRSHCISSRLWRLQWIEKSHQIKYMTFIFCLLLPFQVRDPPTWRRRRGGGGDTWLRWWWARGSQRLYKRYGYFRIIYLKFIYSEKATEIWKKSHSLFWRN